MIPCMEPEGATADPEFEVVASATGGSYELVTPSRKDCGWCRSGCGPG